jgi:chromosomal replication initiator protein
MELEELWQNALGEISINVTPPIFHSWFKNAQLVELRQDGVAVISCHNNFTKEWLQEKCQKLILRSLRNYYPGVKNVIFVVKTEAAKINRKPSIKNVHIFQNQQNILELSVDQETNLNSKYKFSNFIVGSHNELAHAAALSIIENPGTRFNPLFIYGGTGLGKTHLLHAIGNEMKLKYPNKKIRYVTSEKFTEEVVNGMRHQNLDEFKEKYRTLDLLLIDDVQFLSGKEKTQEELFHTFNVLADKNSQVVFSSDRPPKAIPGIEERLLSRFSGGMQADIKTPDFETRVAILKAKLSQQAGEISLDERIIEFIASKIQKNIRELEGALNKVIGYIRLKREIPSFQELEKILGEITTGPTRLISYKTLIRTVAEFYEISEKDLITNSRKKDIVKPRQVAMYLLREDLKYSFPTIGEKFGGKDHTTVIHAYNKIAKEIQQDHQLMNEIETIRAKLSLN